MGVRYGLLVFLGILLGIAGSSIYRLGVLGDQASPDPIVVEIKGEKLTASKIYKDSRQRLYEMESSLFKLRKQIIDDYVESRLLAEESKKLNLPVDQLLLKEVGTDAGPVTEAEVNAFIAEKNLTPGDSKQKADVAEYLKFRKVAEKRNRYLTRLRQAADVKLRLAEPAPPTVKVGTDGFPSWGKTSAPVTVVQFADFQCPFCARSVPSVERLKQEYGPDKIRIVFRDFPMDSHERAIPAANAAHCAHEQGKFWEYASALFENQLALEDADLKNTAAKLSLDQEKFAGCFESKRHQGLVEKNRNEARALGLDSTPTFVVNGVLIIGAQPYEVLKEAVDRVLNPRT